jgi:hypothetical protein
MCSLVYIILEYCGEHRVWFDGFLHVFVCLSNWELLAEQWGRCGCVKVGDANGLLLAVVFLFLQYIIHNITTIIYS